MKFKNSQNLFGNIAILVFSVSYSNLQLMFHFPTAQNCQQRHEIPVNFVINRGFYQVIQFSFYECIVKITNNCNVQRKVCDVRQEAYKVCVCRSSRLILASTKVGQKQNIEMLKAKMLIGRHC